MIIKGGSTSGAGRVAAHVLDGRENEQVEVKELRGVMAGDLRAALREMETAAQCAATRKPLYHASINPRAGEKLTDEQWAVAVDRLEAALGLTGQPRAVVAHVKNGREPAAPLKRRRSKPRRRRRRTRGRSYAASWTGGAPVGSSFISFR